MINENPVCIIEPELPKGYRFTKGFCSLDGRYYPKLRDLAPYLSEEARFEWQYSWQLALAQTLAEYGICSPDDAKVIAEAISQCSANQAYAIEDEIKHDMRSMVRTIIEKIPDKRIASFVYRGATSWDPISSADAARLNAAMRKVIIPALKKLLAAILRLANREIKTVAAGITHGQIAVPVTYGFRFAGFADRLAKSICLLESMKIPGKYSGACGTMASAKITILNPRQFERDILAKFDLNPAMHSTQIVQFEHLLRLLQEIMNAAGIIGDLANDLRHLQRSHIAEVGEPIGGLQVGSSTMPHKKNPETSEQGFGLWKIIKARVHGFSDDQICEDERDLSNSIVSRTYMEPILFFYLQVTGMTRVINKLRIAKTNVERNLISQGDLPLAEPLQQILAAQGYPCDTHEIIRRLTRTITDPQKESLVKKAFADPELAPYLKDLPPEWRAVLLDIHNYTGEAEAITRDVIAHWSNIFAIDLTVE